MYREAVTTPSPPANAWMIACICSGLLLFLAQPIAASDFPDPDIFDGGEPTASASSSSSASKQTESEQDRKTEKTESKTTSTGENAHQKSETTGSSGGSKEKSTGPQKKAGGSSGQTGSTGNDKKPLIASGAFKTDGQPGTPRAFAPVKTAENKDKKIQVSAKYQQETSSEHARKQAEEQVSATQQKARSNNQGAETGETLPSNL